jgi:hypothetical protein
VGKFCGEAETDPAAVDGDVEVVSVLAYGPGRSRLAATGPALLT